MLSIAYCFLPHSEAGSDREQDLDSAASSLGRPDTCTRTPTISKRHNELCAAGWLPKWLQRHCWLWKRASKEAGWAHRQRKTGLYSSDNLFAMNNSAIFCWEAGLNTEH